MRIIALTENTSAKEGIGSEHGLSLWIETEGKTVLFDMGQSDLFLQNAKRLSLDMKKVDVAVLSHGHYDHGGGLGAFFEENQRAPVFLSPHAFERHFHGREKYIGLDPTFLRQDRLRNGENGMTIGEGMTLFTPEGREELFPFSTPELTVIREGEEMPDDFSHEMYLLIEEKGKRVLFSGCSHKGILNIAKWFRPDVMIGGFHVSKLPLDDALLALAEQLNGLDTRFFTCHCTGVAQFEWMKQKMPRLFYLAAGMEIEV